MSLVISRGWIAIKGKRGSYQGKKENVIYMLIMLRIIRQFCVVLHFAKASIDRRPNALPLSCAATKRSERRLCDSDVQNRTDLAAAQRRQLQRLVGPRGFTLHG
jgi:hypothetical protein